MKEMIQFNIDPVLYMHPADRAMLTKLEKMDMVAKLKPMAHILHILQKVLN